MKPTESNGIFARMKFILGSLPYLIFAALIAVGIVKGSKPDGSYLFLIASMVVFLIMVGRCCLPAKH